jgi:putative hydrolase of the HAD superfamily
MVGNSIRSDILPILEMGGSAFYIPYEIDWAHEHDSKPGSSASFHEMKHLGQLSGWLKTMEVKTG